jgi:two-component system sensor histidine kinase BaeS
VPAAGAAPTPPLSPDGPREIRELTHRFNAMTAELDRTRAEERDLLANVRHDLKTPLTVVTGFAEALRDGTATGPEGAARAGDAIAQEAERMGRLVEDLRSIDELGTGGLALRPEALDPARLAADAVARFAPRAAGRVDLRADSDGGLSLAADRAAVERILGNLIDNSLAVARPGGHVLVEARLAAGGSVAFRVSDDGPGFPAGSLERAFDRFFRADLSRTGSGTGLGLSIVRALARAHGGDAVAENLAPSGARVTVTLPSLPSR